MESLIAGYSPVGDNFLFFLCLIFFIALRESFMKKNKASGLIVAALAVLQIAAFANVMTYVACSKSWNVFLVLFFRDVFHGALIVMFVFYDIYLATIMGYDPKGMKFITTTTLIINIVAVAFDTLSPLTHFGLYKDASGVWNDSMWLKPFTVAYIINMIYLGIILFFKKNSLIPRVRLVLILSELLCAFTIFFQNVHGHNSYLAFTFAVPVFVAIIMLHANPYNIDTGALDEMSFSDYLKERHRKKAKDYFMCLRFCSDGEFVMPKQLGVIFYNFYSTYIKDGIIFNPSNGFYILAIKDEKNTSIWDKIKHMAEIDFVNYYKKFKIDYKMAVLEQPNVDSADEFFEVFNYYINKLDINSFKYVKQDAYQEYARHKYIVKELSDIYNDCNLDDPRVKVYAQPIKDVHNNIFNTAESLMRLDLPDFGLVYPDEFIPVAEENGFIHVLSLIILNKVCKFIRVLIDENYNVNRISVNFSITELDTPNFIEEVKSIINRNSIPFSKIGIELTESRNDTDYATVLYVVSELKKLGMPIYLDDFGTGYSNYDRILRLNMDVIKFDRSLLLLYAGREENYTMILHMAEAFHELGYTVLYEGVENESYEKLCIESYADYLQGYYYSKPIPIEQMKIFMDKLQ